MKKNKIIKQNVQVSVYDHASKPIIDAKVTLQHKSSRSKEIITLLFSKKLQVYQGDVNSGIYICKVSAKGLHPDARELIIGPSDLKNIFVLGKKGMPYLYRGKVKVPFESQSHLLGISFKPDITDKDEKNFIEFTRELKLEEEEVGPMIRMDNVRIFRVPADISERTKLNLIARISDHNLVRKNVDPALGDKVIDDHAALIRLHSGPVRDVINGRGQLHGAVVFFRIGARLGFSKHQKDVGHTRLVIIEGQNHESSPLVIDAFGEEL